MVTDGIATATDTALAIVVVSIAFRPLSEVAAGLFLLVLRFTSLEWFVHYIISVVLFRLAAALFSPLYLLVDPFIRWHPPISNRKSSVMSHTRQ